jgi:hypothetical protein
VARRRSDKPIEALRTAWTSTADLEETLAGMFLPTDIRPIAPFPAPVVTSQQEESTPVDTAGVEISPVETPPDISLDDSTGVDIPEIDHTPVETVEPRVSSPVETIFIEPTPVDVTGVNTGKVFLSKAKKRLFRPTHPAEAHTDGEDRLYRFMWEQGREHAPFVRLYIGSMSTLARAMGRDDRNTRPLVESLIRKLAVQIAREQDFGSKQPRAYYVFEYAEVAARRNQAGLSWALKNKGIQLVTEDAAGRLALDQAQTTPIETDIGVLTPVETILNR